MCSMELLSVGDFGSCFGAHLSSRTGEDLFGFWRHAERRAEDSLEDGWVDQASWFQWMQYFLDFAVGRAEGAATAGAGRVGV